MHERDFIVAATVMQLEQAPSSSQRRSGRLIDGYPDGDPKRNDCATRPDQWWHWWDVREWSVGFGDCIYAIKLQRRGAGWWGEHHSFQRPLSREMRPSTLWAALQTAFCCTCGDIPPATFGTRSHLAKSISRRHPIAPCTQEPGFVPFTAFASCSFVRVSRIWTV
jgi:hypothetical protein